MTYSSIVEEWRRGRDLLVSRLSEKDPGIEITMRMSKTYGRLTSMERGELDPLLREWLLSENDADRYDAISIVGDNCVTSMIPALRELQDRLEASTDIGAPYEWATVNRTLGRLVAATDSDAADDPNDSTER